MQHARVWLKFELKEVEVERANKLVKWTARVLKLLQNIMLSIESCLRARQAKLHRCVV